MKRNLWIIVVLLTLVISSCGSSATPTVNPADIQSTAAAAAFTMIAQTQAAIPTNTPVPPTETAIPTSLPTETPLPLPTLDLSAASPTNIPTFTPQASSSSSSSSGDACNQPLTKWLGPTATMSVENETKPKGTIVLSAYVVTDLGECGYLYITGSSFSGPVGQYSVGAFVNGKKNFKVFGGFRITEGGWNIVVRNDKIVALGGCYPHC
jgi:hypothetical protein